MDILKSYTKDAKGQLSNIERDGHGANVSYTYDSLYNLSKKETVYTVNSTTKKYSVDYEYNTIDSYRKGTRITKESFSVGSTNKGNIGYEYCKNGNIAKVKENNCDEIFTFIYMDKCMDDLKIALIEQELLNKGLLYEKKQKKYFQRCTCDL